jgi:hypothetical protein
VGVSPPQAMSSAVTATASRERSCVMFDGQEEYS